MSLYHSVLKQYSAPTCNLEILSRTPAIETSDRNSRRSPLSFQLQIHPPSSLEEDRDVDAGEPTALTWVVQGTLDQLQLLHTAVKDYLRRFLSKTDFTGLVAQTEPAGKNQVQILPKALTRHSLQLGSLSVSPGVSVIELASTQLFDIVGTLDRYASEAKELALQPQAASRPWVKRGLIAAGVVAVGSGFAGLLSQWIPLPQNPLTQVASKSSQDKDKAAVSAPETGASNLGILPPLPNGTASPNPVGLSKTTPLPTGIPLPPSGSHLSPTPIPSAILQVPGVPAPSGNASQPTPLPTSALIIPSTAKITPGSTTLKLTPVKGITVKPPQPPKPNVVIASRSGGQSQTLSRQPNPPAPVGAIAAAPPADSFEATPAETTATADAKTAASPLSGASTRPKPLETLAPLQAARPQAAAMNSQPGGGTLFDTIQQVGEVRQYFQSRWTPPSGLSQVLEYQLMLNSDGSLWQISPLGEAAGRFIDRTGMPLVGAPFVSPIPDNQKAKIRLVLSPDGQVKTFFEGLK